MARIRSLKPEFWHDRKLARQTSRDARMLYMGLWNHADEHARANGDLAVIKGQVFPYEELDVDALLDELEAVGVVIRYEVDDDPFLFLPKLSKHQRLEPSKVASKFPDVPEQPVSRRKSASNPDESASDSDDHGSAPETGPDLHTQILSDESEKTCAESENSAASLCNGVMDQGGRARKKRATPPPPELLITDELRGWARLNTPGINLEAETDKMLDWARGKGENKSDWVATWRNWMRRAQENVGSQSRQTERQRVSGVYER